MSLLSPEVQKAIDSRRAAVLQESKSLLNESFGSIKNIPITGQKYLDEARKAYRTKNGKDMPINLEACLLQGLKETKATIIESLTKSSDTGTFVDYGYQLVSAVLPNLVLDEVGSIQPLKVRTGDVFWLDYLFATNRGKIIANTKVFDATAGPSSNVNFANEVVEQEALLQNGTSSSGSVAYTPIRAAEEIILYYTVGTTDYEVTATVSGTTATFTQAATITSGTLDLTNGQYAIVFVDAPVADTVMLTYQATFEENLSSIQKIKIALRQLSVTARQYKLSSQYTLDASYDLSQAHGVDIDPLMVAALSSTIRYEIDTLGLNQIRTGAGNGTYQVEWNKRVPVYIDIYQHYRSFLVALTEASNIIFNATKMVGGNVIIAGLDAMNIIESLATVGAFEPTLPNGEMGSFAGPHVAGILNKRFKVIKNPNYPSTDFVVGHKGGNYLESGFVFAPYRPLYTTPAIAWEDDTIRRGMATSAGMRMLNNKLFVKGRITNVAYS